MANYDSTPTVPSIKIVLGPSVPPESPFGQWMRPASLRGALGVFELPDVALTSERPSADDVRAAVLRTVAEATDHNEDPASVRAERLWAECDFAVFAAVVRSADVAFDDGCGVPTAGADPLRCRYGAFLDAARTAYASEVETADPLFDAMYAAEVSIDLGADVHPTPRADRIRARVAIVDDRIVVEIGEERLSPAQVRELHERLSAANVYNGPQTVDEILGTAPTPAPAFVDVPRIVLGPSEIHEDSTPAEPLFVRRAELQTLHGRYRLPSVLLTSERPTSAEVLRELLADLESVAPAGESTAPADAAVTSFADLLRSSAVVIDDTTELSPEASALRSLVSAVLAADCAPDDAPNLDALIGAVDSSAVAIDLGPDEIDLSIGGALSASLEFSGAAERLAVTIGAARVSIPQVRRLYGALARCGAFTAPDTLEEMRAGVSSK